MSVAVAPDALSTFFEARDVRRPLVCSRHASVMPNLSRHLQVRGSCRGYGEVRTAWALRTEMENINESIARGMESDRPKVPKRPIDARACMTTNLITFSPSHKLREVMRTLLKYNISGAPVVDKSKNVVGIVSELDCVRVIASGSYDHAPYQMERSVGGFMSEHVVTVGPGEEVFSLVSLFEKHSVRLLPVIEDGVLIGLVSRRDVMRQWSLRY